MHQSIVALVPLVIYRSKWIFFFKGNRFRLFNMVHSGYIESLRHTSTGKPCHISFRSYSQGFWKERWNLSETAEHDRCIYIIWLSVTQWVNAASLTARDLRLSQQKTINNNNKKNRLAQKPPSNVGGAGDKRGCEQKETRGGRGAGDKVNVAVLTSMRAARPAMKARR